jgi:hypothetical protein
MDTRTREFRDLTDWLGLPAAEVAVIVGRSMNMVRQYRAERGRVPTEEVLETLRAHRRSQLRARLDRAVADLREAGIEIDIGWGPVLRRAAAQTVITEEFMAAT